MSDTLTELTRVLAERKQHADPQSSYVASLHDKGLNKILEKLGEEATEVILAAKDANIDGNANVITETADLWFHSLVMLSHLGEDYTAVLAELESRFNLSGLAEKASRKQS